MNGEQILATDLRGAGQRFPTTCGSSTMLEPYSSNYMYVSYASMMDENYLSQRVFDMLRAMDFLEDGKPRSACEIANYLPSYELLIDSFLHNWPLSCLIENCLAAFDLTDVYAALGARLRKRKPWGPGCPSDLACLVRYRLSSIDPPRMDGCLRKRARCAPSVHRVLAFPDLHVPGCDPAKVTTETGISRTRVQARNRITDKSWKGCSQCVDRCCAPLLRIVHYIQKQLVDGPSSVNRACRLGIPLQAERAQSGSDAVARQRRGPGRLGGGSSLRQGACGTR